MRAASGVTGAVRFMAGEEEAAPGVGAARGSEETGSRAPRSGADARRSRGGCPRRTSGESVEETDPHKRKEREEDCRHALIIGLCAPSLYALLTRQSEGFAYRSRPVTLQQLTYFLAAAEHGSFSAPPPSRCTWPSRACPSRSAGSRPSSASTLFARAGRGLELTEAGRRLRPQAERTLDSAREARRVACARCASSPAAPRPSARSATRRYYLLADLVHDFRKRHPNVRVRARRPELRPRSPTPCARAGSRAA